MTYFYLNPLILRMNKIGQPIGVQLPRTTVFSLTIGINKIDRTNARKASLSTKKAAGRELSYLWPTKTTDETEIQTFRSEMKVVVGHF